MIFARSRYSSPADHITEGSVGGGTLAVLSYRAAMENMVSKRRAGMWRGRRLIPDELSGSDWGLPNRSAGAVADRGIDLRFSVNAEEGLLVNDREGRVNVSEVDIKQTVLDRLVRQLRDILIVSLQYAGSVRSWGPYSRLGETPVKRLEGQ